MNLVDISGLEAKVHAVVVQRQQLEDAILEERTQRAKLLKLVLGTVKPALPALVGKIKTGSYYYGDSNGYRSTDSHHEQKGVRIDGVDGPQKDNPGDRTGAFEGWDTFLLADGSVLDLVYTGTWSVYDGAQSEWSAQATLVHVDEAAEYLVTENSDRRVIEAIVTTLDAHVSGKANKRIEQARARAEKLKAILTLAI